MSLRTFGNPKGHWHTSLKSLNRCVQYSKRYLNFTDIIHRVVCNTARDIFSSRHLSQNIVQHSKRHLFFTTSFIEFCTTQQEISLPHDILHTVVYSTARGISSSRHLSHSCVQHSKRHLFLTTSFTHLCTTQQETSFLHGIFPTFVYNKARDIFSSRHLSHSCVQHSKRHTFLTISFTQLCTTKQEIFPSRHASHSCVQLSKRHLFLTTSFTQVCKTQQETSLPHDILHTVVHNTARDISSLRHPSHNCVQHSKRYLYFTTSLTQLCTTQQEVSIPSHRLYKV
jgi:hypothetical protein